jgi:hypothetical protein
LAEHPDQVVVATSTSDRPNTDFGVFTLKNSFKDHPGVVVQAPGKTCIDLKLVINTACSKVLNQETLFFEDLYCRTNAIEIFFELIQSFKRVGALEFDKLFNFFCL